MKLVGYAYYAKSSGELTLVKNPDLYNLPHVFPIYAEEKESDDEDRSDK